jgi:hypothetical protein
MCVKVVALVRHRSSSEVDLVPCEGFRDSLALPGCATYHYWQLPVCIILLYEGLATQVTYFPIFYVLHYIKYPCLPRSHAQTYSQ